MADGKQQQPGQTQERKPTDQAQTAGPSAAPTPLQARQLRITRARRYNKEHAGESAEFQRLTGIDPMQISAVQQWQAKRGLKADGKIGLQTIEAASEQSPIGGTLVASNGPVALPAATPKAATPGAGTAPASAPASATPTAKAASAAPAADQGEKAGDEHEESIDLHHDPRVKKADEIHHLGKEQDHEEHKADDEHDVGTVGRVKDKDYPEDVVQVPHGYMGKKVELTPETAAAYEALLSHARAAGFADPLFTIMSAWRSDSHQKDIAAKAERNHPGENNRKWVAKPGGSAHRTGHAIDFWLGINNERANVDKQRALPEYKWLKDNAASYGFSPYEAEPWHWEFNPKGDKL